MKKAERSIKFLIITQSHILGDYTQQDISDFLIPDMTQSLPKETLLLHGLSAMASMRHSTSAASKPHSNSLIWQGKTTSTEISLLISGDNQYLALAHLQEIFSHTESTESLSYGYQSQVDDLLTTFTENIHSFVGLKHNIN